MDIHQRHLTPEEVITIVGTGARPICFCENEESDIWGIGSSFLINYLGHILVITAKHVIENLGADPRHTRILMPNTTVALPIKSSFTPIFYEHENKADAEDLLFFNIDDELFCQESGLDLYSWDFMGRSFPTSKLEVGDELLVAGFPSTEERYNYDEQRINDTLLLRTAILVESQLGKDIYTMSGTASEFDFNGMSGAPVFCRREGMVLFSGLVIRGSSSSGILHFLSSEIVMSALNNSGIKPNNSKHPEAVNCASV